MRGYVLVGCLIDAAVDMGSGAMDDLLPNPVNVRLVPLSLDLMSASGGPFAQAAVTARQRDHRGRRLQARTRQDPAGNLIAGSPTAHTACYSEPVGGQHPPHPQATRAKQRMMSWA